MLNKFISAMIFSSIILLIPFNVGAEESLRRQIGLILYSRMSHFEIDSIISQLSEDGIKLLIDTLRTEKIDSQKPRVIVSLHLATRSNEHTMKFQQEILAEYYRLLEKSTPNVKSSILSHIHWIADSNTIYHIIPLLYNKSGKKTSHQFKALRNLADTTHIDLIMDALDKRRKSFPSNKKNLYLAMQIGYSIVRDLMIKKIQSQLSVETLVGKKQALQSQLDSIRQEEKIYKKRLDDFMNN